MIRLCTDVLVVGGGAAGLKAALTAADQGANVILAVDQAYSGSTFYANSPEWGLPARGTGRMRKAFIKISSTRPMAA